MYPWETAQKIYFSGGSFTVRLSRDFFHNCLTREPFTHTHPEYELHYIKEGDVLLMGAGEEVICKEKCILIIPPFCSHTVKPITENAVTCTLLFSPDEEYKSDVIYRAICNHMPLCIDDSFGAEKIFAHIGEVLMHERGAYIDIIRGNLTVLFAELASTVSEDEEIQPGKLDENRAGQIELYLAENYASPTCSCQELAEIMRLSPRQVHRLCTTYYGISFREMLHKRRMEIARHRLRLDTSSVTEIAEQIGYASLASFSSAYKRYYGHSPRKKI